MIIIIEKSVTVNKCQVVSLKYACKVYKYRRFLGDIPVLSLIWSFCLVDMNHAKVPV